MEDTDALFERARSAGRVGRIVPRVVSRVEVHQGDKVRALEAERRDVLNAARARVGLPAYGVSRVLGRGSAVDRSPLLSIGFVGGSGAIGRYEATEADASFVAGARACGASRELIASVLRVTVSALDRHFGLELAVSPAMGVLSAATRLLQRGLVDGDVGALKAYLAAHGGPEWRSNREVKGSLQWGADGRGRQVVTFTVEGFDREGELEGLSGAEGGVEGVVEGVGDGGLDGGVVLDGGLALPAGGGGCGGGCGGGSGGGSAR